MATQISIILEVDEDDADPSDGTGLTEAAYLRLSEVLSAEGYMFVSGPDLVHA